MSALRASLLGTLLLLSGFVGAIPAGAEDAPKVDPKVTKVAAALQQSSVTIRCGPYSGSGSIVKTKDGQVWVWTAAHVVKPCRHTREVVDEKGGKRTKVEYDDAKIQQFNKNKSDGRIVSNFTADAEIVRVSDDAYGHDLALLRVRDTELKVAASTKFYLDKELPEIGEELYHCGSLLGPMGSNSLTFGIVSQHGRVFDGKIYDQTTATSFPGSSGGIVCLKGDGRYVGMLVMGAGEGFGLIVPVRRMQKWAKEVGVEFALDPSKPVPDDKKLFERSIEDSASSGGGESCCKERMAAHLKYMVADERDPLVKSKKWTEWFARKGLLWAPPEE